MRNMKVIRLLLLFCLPLLVGCSQVQERSVSDKDSEPLLVFLVRHGEKVDQSRDPELSPAGYVRAATLAHSLQNSQIQHVHSTDFIRTRKTAEPAAAIHGLELEIYDPSDLKSFAEELLEKGGRHLVVGHSNTTPRMVELLGGESGEEIHEPDEYDRLYLLTIDGRGEVNTILLRYGAPSSFPSRISASSRDVPHISSSALKLLQTVGLAG
jgi:phosphohistidine phosphatase SixA